MAERREAGAAGMYSPAEVAEERRRSLRRYLICLGVLGIVTAANISMMSHTLFHDVQPCSATMGGGRR